MAQQQTKPENRQLVPVDHIEPPRLPITQAMMAKIGVDEATWRVLTDSIFPSARTVEGIKLALDYCRARNYDIMTKPVHVVPTWNSTLKRQTETVWLGIHAMRITAARTGHYKGNETSAVLGPMIEREFIQMVGDDRSGQTREVKETVKYPEWCQYTVFKDVLGEKCGFSATVYWEETYATAGRGTDMPNEMWRKRPRGQLEKCAEAAALRRAFPEQLSGQYTVDEMEGKIIDGELMIGSQNPAGETIPSAQGSVRGAAPMIGQPPVGAAPTDAAGEQAAALRAKAKEMAGPSNEKAKINTPAEDPVGEGEGDEFDFYEFEQRIMEAPDKEAVDAIFDGRRYDIHNRFIDDPDKYHLASKIKQRRLKKLAQEAIANG